MATRRFTEYVVGSKTYYHNLREKGLAFKHAQEVADRTGSIVEMKILRGWIQEDPSGFVADSEVTSETTKKFKPKARKNVSEGFMQKRGKRFVFHPIRAASDYSRKAAGEGPKRRAKKKGRRRNTFEPGGHSKTWYRKGQRAVFGRHEDMYAAWHSAKGKPTTSGNRVTAQESFFQGYIDQKRRQESATRGNPSVPKGWIKAKAVKITKLRGGAVNVKIRR